MSSQLRLLALGGALAAAVVAGPARAQVTATPGWAVGSIDTPGDVQGGVVRSGGAILVGQGSFGAGQMSIIRLENGMATTIATGFNALGGFALDNAGTLFVADNGGNLTGASTGDTVFAIPNALTRTTAQTAAGAEVVPAGSIPFAQDVALDGADLIVSDAVGPPSAGRVVRVSNGMVTPLVTGLAYAAGVTVDGTRLLVGNVDGSFVGHMAEYTLTGTLVGSVGGDLSGNYTHVLDGDGNVLVSGGFTDDFSSSTVIAIAPGGAVTERATGFAFSTEMFHDTVRNETLVLDGGASEITVICRDANDDDVCDADQPCAAITGAKLLLKKQSTPAGDDGLKLLGQMTVSGTVNPMDDGARVVVTDGGGTIADVIIPSGLPWAVNRTGTVFKWSDPAGLSGIVKMIVKVVPSTPGLVKLVVLGKNGAFATTPAELPLGAEITLGAGQCGDVAFAGAACAFNGRGTVVKCQ
jgi:hypothetical protein